MSEQLLDKIKNCANLPSLPSIAVEVLELAQKSDADISAIAKLISKDPALSTKILRTVNSSFYGRGQTVTTISHALVILGLQSVKTLVLGFSLVSNLSKGKTKGFKHLTYWKRSLYGATAARVMAQRLGMVQQEEAFLCGLLQDIGMLVLEQVVGDIYNPLYDSAVNHTQLVEAEKRDLGITHADVGGFLAAQWKLPPLLQVPIRHHHSPDEVKDAQLKRLAELVDWSSHCADVFVDEVAKEAIAAVRKIASDKFSITEAACDETLDEIGKKTKEVAGLFEINIGASVNFEDILRKANETLVELTLASAHQATQLQQQNQQLQARVTTDGLTGLSNRAHFDEFFAEQVAHALASGGTLALVMVDIDKFKSVNDTHGHPAGDAVIKATARLLKAATRKTDLSARYGGEEFALVMPNTTRQQAITVAETLRRALAAKEIPIGPISIPVTASFGVACVEPGSPLKLPEHLIKAADLALYNAKKSGRNQVKAFAPTKPAAAIAA